MGELQGYNLRHAADHMFPEFDDKVRDWLAPEFSTGTTGCISETLQGFEQSEVLLHKDKKPTFP